jgi:hypothetical protein
MKVTTLVKEHPILTSLAVLALTVGIVVLISKANNDDYGDADRYTEFDTTG